MEREWDDKQNNDNNIKDLEIKFRFSWVFWPICLHLKSKITMIFNGDSMEIFELFSI